LLAAADVGVVVGINSQLLENHRYFHTAMMFVIEDALNMT
jgi:hypothetical protein